MVHRPSRDGPSEESIMFGNLIPIGGGDPIPLLKKDLVVGRRESCDVVLRFDNVSSHHCKLECHGGYWYVRDTNSKNGVRVNDVRVAEKLLNPGDELRVAKHRYRVEYSPIELGAIGPPPADHMPTDVLKKSLLERAGLQRSKLPTDRNSDPPRSGRFDLLNDEISNLSTDKE